MNGANRDSGSLTSRFLSVSNTRVADGWTQTHLHSALYFFLFFYWNSTNTESTACATGAKHRIPQLSGLTETAQFTKRLMNVVFSENSKTILRENFHILMEKLLPKGLESLHLSTFALQLLRTALTATITPRCSGLKKQKADALIIKTIKPAAAPSAIVRDQSNEWKRTSSVILRGQCTGEAAGSIPSLIKRTEQPRRLISTGETPQVQGRGADLGSSDVCLRFATCKTARYGPF